MRRGLFSTALLIALFASLILLPACQTRTVNARPIPVEYRADPELLAEQLVGYVDGSGGSGNHKGFGQWAVDYTGGPSFPATLKWNKHVLTAQVHVFDGRVEVTVLETKNLKEKGAKIHKVGAANMLALRATVTRAIGLERGNPALVRDSAAPLRPLANSVAPAPSRPPAEQRFTRSMPAPQPAPTSDDLLAGVNLGRYYALVIGNNSYRNLPRLRTPVPDAAVVSSLLELDYGFDVELLTDASRTEIVSALNRYRARLGDNDNLLVYYAGHGWFDTEAERGYWLPIDARENDPSNWISNATISDMVRAIPAKHVMLVADSCYSGTLTRGISMRPPGNRYLAGIAQKRARTVLTSGGLEPVEDGSGKHSIFAGAFIEALRENGSVIDGQTLFTEIRRPVMLDADQTPEYGDIRRAGHDGGDFLFVRRR